MDDIKHVSVLPREVLHWLDPQPGQVIVDATVGVGGHAGLIWDRIYGKSPLTPNPSPPEGRGEEVRAKAPLAPDPFPPDGRGEGVLVALDQDPGMIEMARQRLRDPRVIWRQRNFEDLASVLDELKMPTVDAILADLGFCSDQMGDPARGFSFHLDGPLDMRLDPTRGEPATALIRRSSEKELADIFWQYGEERFSRRVARMIVETRQRTPIVTTGQLAELVRKCVPRSKGHSIDPATRVFQGLRIAVNDELGALERFLQILPDCLKPGGKAAIISFHSLEDRLVKQAFRKNPVWGKELTRKPVGASAAEISVNPRARSAKLRVAQKNLPLAA